MRLHATALLAVLSGGALLAAQQTTTFRGEVRTVAVYATVVDADGRLVPDLTRDAFEILDNRAPQPISIFTNDIQPITVVMMLDRSGSMRQNFSLVRRAAEAFVARMQPADKARIGSFSDRIQVDPRSFTSDRGELVTILRTELQRAGPTPLWNAVNVGITALLHEDGRRVILVFTDGVDSPMHGTNASLKDVMKRAQKEEVMVYAIGLAGQNLLGGPSGFRRLTLSRDQKPDPGLEKITRATGGGYFELTSADDLAATFQRVADELHHQYVLGFSPQALDGKTHKLEVRVLGEGRTVRARTSYVASKGP